jgi:CHAD domain-containing protein
VPKHHHSADHEGRAQKPSRDVPFAVVGATILRQQYEQMRAAESGTRAGDDIEAVHRMRVATSRLRAALRVFAVDDARDTFERLRADARDVAHALGAVRDLDVLGEYLAARAEGRPADAPAIDILLAALRRVRAERQEKLQVVLDGPIARRFSETFPAAVDALDQAADPRMTVGDVAPGLLRGRLRKVSRSLRGIPAPTSSELHRVRIRCKRLRYVGEFFRPWFGKRTKPLIESTTHLQDTLGALHDADVAPESLQTLVDVTRASRGSGPADRYDLASATLGIVSDRQRQRDELLLRFRDEWAKLRGLA